MEKFQRNQSMQSLKTSALDGHKYGEQYPSEYRLYQNFPQTFYKVTRIGFDISSAINVKLAIYDVFGRDVGILVDKELNPGSYEVVWNACKLQPGIYYYKIIAGEFTDSRKVFLLGK